MKTVTRFFQGIGCRFGRHHWDEAGCTSCGRWTVDYYMEVLRAARERFERAKPNSFFLGFDLTEADLQKALQAVSSET